MFTIVQRRVFCESFELRRKHPTMNGKTLHRNSARQYLYDHIIGQIRSGLLAPGVPLATVRQLSEMFSLSTGTVQNVLKQLAAEGWIYQKPYVGSFVAERESLQSAGPYPASASDERFEKGILKRTDNVGCVWALQKASGASLLSFRKPGSPIMVKTKVRRVNSGMVSIELVLEGRAGETYRPMVQKNNSASPAPWMRIIDRRGTVVDEAQFAYG